MTFKSRLTSPVLTRTCTTCHSALPLTAFRARSRTNKGPRSECRSCHNLAEKARYYAKRDAKSANHINAMVNRIRRARSERLVPEICHEMTSRFGGVEALVEVWHACWTTDLKKGRAKASAHFLALLRLIEWIEKNPPNFSSLTDSEIDRMIGDLTGQST